MELRQLEYFIAVANELSFSRAARRVHIVQSALSVSVGKLEKEFGVELFDRSRQQIRLTPAGELLLVHARQVLRAARTAKDAMNDDRGKVTGTVEFGSLVSFGRFDLPKVLGEFHRRYPLVRLKLRQAPFGSNAYLPAIADGSLDLALISAPDHFPPNIDMRLLSQDEMVFVCRPDHRVAGREAVPMTELAGEELIQFPKEYGLRRLIDDAFAAAETEPDNAYEISTEYLVAAQLVANGLGTTFMPSSEAERFTDLRAVPLRPAVMWKIYLACLRPGSETLGTAAARLAEALLKESTQK